MGSTGLRSFVKGLSWELIGLVILLMLTKSLKVSFAYLIIRIFTYYFHERLWKRVSWGKL